MQIIQLTKGQVALVDDSDYAELSRYNWYASESKGSFYAARGEYIAPGRTLHILMHRQILAFPDHEVDHRDGNTLDNRRLNLREATSAQNKYNRLQFNSTGFKGVHPHKNRFRAVIQTDGTTLRLGSFDTPGEAHEAYKLAALCLHGDFARAS